MTKRALITGCAGFAGRALWRRLAAAGWNVCGCDRRETIETGEHVTACDISDPVDVERLFYWAGKVTHVFHLAAITFIPDTVQSPRRSFDVNVMGTVALVDAVRAKLPSARFVFVGSSEVYGPPVYLPQDENHPFNPGNPYAISKAAADQYCRYACNAIGQDIVRVRPFNHSGPGQSPAFVLPSFAQQIARIETGAQEPILRVGSLEVARDFSHVDDVVRAYELIALAGETGEVYNVCSGASVPLRGIVDELVARARTPIRIEIDPERLRPVDVPDVCGSHDRLTKALGWRPEKSMSHLLDDLMAYWRKAVSDDTTG